MLPILAIVGRPNVGKSTLFNALTRRRDALVADRPGITRDRNYGIARSGERRYVVIDTGGLSTDADAIARMTVVQAETAMDEAHVILFLVDARQGLNAEDERIARELRVRGTPVILVANKVDGLDSATVTADFHRLGFETLLPISASHRQGLRALTDAALDLAPAGDEPDEEDDQGAIRVAIVGRPNVGKSTLVNRLTGSDRVVAHDTPGTTRDSVSVPFSRDGHDYVLVDTAGLRRRARVADVVEKFSALKTIEAIERAQVVVLMLDARDGVMDHDAHLLGLILEAGRAIVIAANKWDGLSGSQRTQVKRELDRKLHFIDFATVRSISALHGSGLAELLGSVRDAHASATARLPTPELTRILHAAVEKTPPPAVRGRRIRLRYAHQGGSAPPRIIIHGNQTEALPQSYRRYLERVFRDAFRLSGTPIAIELRTGENPFKGRRNTLTPRQQRKRKRLVRRVRKR